MTDTQLLIIERGLDRLLVDICAGVSLILGWNLFRKGIVPDQSAEFSRGSWTLRLQRVGPGILFALFGITCLSVSLLRPLRIGSSGVVATSPPATASGSTTKAGTATPASDVVTVAQTSAAQQLITYAGPGDDQSADILDDRVRALNTVCRVLPNTKMQPLSPSESRALTKSQAILERLRRELLARRFGERLAQYDLYRSDPRLLADAPQTTKDRYNEVERIETGSLIGQ